MRVEAVTVATVAPLETVTGVGVLWLKKGGVSFRDAEQEMG